MVTSAHSALLSLGHRCHPHVSQLWTFPGIPVWFGMSPSSPHPCWMPLSQSVYPRGWRAVVTHASHSRGDNLWLLHLASSSLRRLFSELSWHLCCPSSCNLTHDSVSLLCLGRNCQGLMCLSVQWPWHLLSFWLWQTLARVSHNFFCNDHVPSQCGLEPHSCLMCCAPSCPRNFAHALFSAWNAFAPSLLPHSFMRAVTPDYWVPHMSGVELHPLHKSC